LGYSNKYLHSYSIFESENTLNKILKIFSNDIDKKSISSIILDNENFFTSLYKKYTHNNVINNSLIFSEVDKINEELVSINSILKFFKSIKWPINIIKSIWKLFHKSISNIIDQYGVSIVPKIIVGIIIFILTVFTSIKSEANPISKQNIEQDSSKIVIPFLKTDKSSLVIVPLSLNGKFSYFLVDCGSELTILEKSQSDLFGFSIDDDENTENADWSGNSVSVSKAKYATIMIGNIKIWDNIKVANVRNLLGGISARVHANIVGIIGSDILKKNHLMIDYSNMTLHN
jgi:hypothetical protein